MIRKVKKIVKGKDTVDGAGVHLIRVIGKPDVEDFDPFLMLDAFDSENPETYIKGFPWHPHRGIETVTYLLQGEVQHGDSIGNSGVITDGDCQWMTAGSGIIHQEMPQAAPKMLGTQLWINLPAKDKMTVPKYRDFKQSDIPLVETDQSRVRVIAGEYRGVRGPMEEITVQPIYLDVSVNPHRSFSFETDSQNTLFIYIINGSAILPAENNRVLPAKQAVLFGQGDEMKLNAGDKNLRFLLFSGNPLNEPIEWGGPVVMNTKEELQLAFEEIKEGTFIKEHNSDGTINNRKINRSFYS
ncbi:MAG: pirin family protein [Bacillota bacterium]